MQCSNQSLAIHVFGVWSCDKRHHIRCGHHALQCCHEQRKPGETMAGVRDDGGGQGIVALGLVVEAGGIARSWRRSR